MFRAHSNRRFARNPNRRSSVATLLVASVVWFVGFDLPAAATNRAPGLFGQHEPLAMEFLMDMRALCRSPELQDCEDVPATLVLRASEGHEQRIEALVRVRGRWRPETGNCRFPALFVFFPDSKTRGTVFEGQQMLPLTTHCQNRQPSYDQYVLKEYLAFRIYNTLTDKSLRVRLARITYRDTRGRGKAIDRYGFFTEHFDALAARHGAEVWEPEKFDALRADPMELATLSLFQYLIGNTDWSVIYGHNIMYIRDPEGLVTAVPFDFDFSGLVNAEYADPPPELPIRNVRQRLYRGFCRPDLNWEALFEHFEDRESAILELVEGIPDLRPSYRKSTDNYVAGFFRDLESPERRQKTIIEGCRPKR